MNTENEEYSPSQRELTDTQYIRFVNANMVKYIEANRKPRGLFVQRGRGKFIGIRNQTGTVWKKEFENKMSCLDWLTGSHQTAVGSS